MDNLDYLDKLYKYRFEAEKDHHYFTQAQEGGSEREGSIHRSREIAAEGHVNTMKELLIDFLILRGFKI